MTDDTDRARRVIRARREAAEKGVCPNAMCGEPLEPGQECPICSRARAALNETIPIEKFVPYVEGTPGIRMTFACSLDLGHEGRCLPTDFRLPAEVLTKCPERLMIDDDELNALAVDDMLDKVDWDTAVMSMGVLAPGQEDVIGESETIVFDQLIGPPMALRQKKEPKQ